MQPKRRRLQFKSKCVADVEVATAVPKMLAARKIPDGWRSAAGTGQLARRPNLPTGTERRREINTPPEEATKTTAARCYADISIEALR